MDIVARTGKVKVKILDIFHAGKAATFTSTFGNLSCGGIDENEINLERKPPSMELIDLFSAEVLSGGMSEIIILY